MPPQYYLKQKGLSRLLGLLDRLTIFAIVILIGLGSLQAQGRTTGIVLKDGSKSADGYTLFNSLSSKTTWLIDGSGRVANSWESDFVIGNSAYLLPDGDLLRTADPGPPANRVFVAGGDSGRVERYSWDGTLEWEFDYNDDTVRHHHDIAPLPNGNVLILAWEFRSRTDAVAAGRDPALLLRNAVWPEHIIEVKPEGASGGTIVWEWHVWDHLVQDFDATKANFGVVEDQPGKLDINYVDGVNTGEDWLHGNAIDYNAELDQILLCSPNFGEFWIIDHSTTSGEAAGPAGDILYRWGNPEAYKSGTAADRQLFNQHDARWIEPGLPGAGNFLVFNNLAGDAVGQSFSAVDEIASPVQADGTYPKNAGQAYGPAAPSSRYTAPNPTDFLGSFLSGAHRLSNGNTLICNGPDGVLFEVTSGGEEVWRYIVPDSATGIVNYDHTGILNNRLFRATRYPADYSGVLCEPITVGDTVEGNPVVAPLSSPLDLSGSVLWLDANDPDGDSNSGGTFFGGTTWVDKSSTGSADAVQGTNANLPSIVPGVANGRQALRFDGSDDFLDIANGGLLSGKGGATLIAAVAPTGSGAQQIMALSAGADTDGIRAGLDVFGEASEVVAGSGDFGIAGRRLDTGATQRIVGGEAEDGKFSIVSGVLDYQNGGAELSVDGQLASRITNFQSSGLSGAADSVTVRVGAGVQGSPLADLFAGDIGELIIYDRVLNPSELDAVHDWLAARWKEPPLSLADWKAAVFTPTELADPTLSGDLADADNDGLSTLLEFALGGDPKSPDAERSPSVSVEGGGIKIRYNQRRDAGFHLCIEASSDLSSWLPAAVVESSSTDFGDGTNIVTLSIAAGINPAQFYRARVTATVP